MAKTMYSLMLTEEIVNAIDRLAAASGTSRSALINGILAEYVSYRTPEMRMRDLFDRMERQLSGQNELQVMLRSSDSLFHLRSMLNYKYNPIVNYSVQLYHTASDTFGELRIGLRTQNADLKLCLMQFYKLWARLEAAYNRNAQCSINGERFTKKLALPHDADFTEEDLSAAVSEYITGFDRALKAFFASINDPERAVRSVEELYRQSRQSSKFLL